MRNKVLPALLTVVLLLTGTGFDLRSSAAEYRVVSSAAVVMDADTGEILYSKKGNTKHYPASITKILTGLIAVEHCRTGDVLRVSDSAVNIPRGYAHLALLAGDTIVFDDAMHALMLASANDAANVLAEHVAGSQSAFAEEMNTRAKLIGAYDSNFTNAHGMPSDRHYTTAYDMALITREAIKNPRFLHCFGSVSHTLPSFNHQTQETEITGYQFMLLEDKDEFDPSVIGGKIGYTGEAGHTMVTTAARNGRTLICVVLGSTADGRYEDTRVLLDHGFRQLNE